MIMNVLSLFDWMSCGQLALHRAWIEVDNYFASEIDKFAIAVTQENFPGTVQLWDVNDRESRDTGALWDIRNIDLIIWWSPCQWFSFAWKKLAFDDERSKLFFEMVKIIEYYKPKYFLLENVKMKKEYQDIITKYMWVEPIEINSSLVSAQSRKRLYRTNIPWVQQPEDKWIFLKDIIENWFTDRNKSYAIDASYYKWTSPSIYFERKRRQWIFCVAQRWRYIVDWKRQDHKMKTAWKTEQRIEPRFDGKTNTLTTVQKDNMIFEPKILQKWRWFNKWWIHENKSPTLSSSRREMNNFLIWDIPGEIRKLTPVECERLQTVPDNYTLVPRKKRMMSNTQRYKMLWNWRTIDVIAHIFSYL